MNDAWVCGACTSINRQRDDRCYSCNGRRDGAMPQEGPDLRVAAAVANRGVRGDSSSMPFALITAVLILAVAGLGAVVSIIGAGTIEGAVNAFGSMIDQLTVLTLVTETMIAVGAVLIVVIMIRIERRASARDREIRAAFLGPEGVA
jgi:uncharacterized membrane protein YqgA involved in biofilm formation